MPFTSPTDSVKALKNKLYPRQHNIIIIIIIIISMYWLRWHSHVKDIAGAPHNQQLAKKEQAEALSASGRRQTIVAV